MNLDLYTDEYRNFKFLKSSPDHVEYFKTARQAINHIQSWGTVYDPAFDWPNRVEFCEQLLDLRHDSAYIVVAGDITTRYEGPSILEILHPVILTENPIIYETSREATFEDIPIMEDYLIPHFCLCEEHSFDDIKNISTFNGHGRIIRLETLPVVPHSKSDFTEIFFDKGTAEKYSKCLYDFLRHKMGAMSAITARF